MQAIRTAQTESEADATAPETTQMGEHLETTLVNEAHKARPRNRDQWVIRMDEAAINAWLAAHDVGQLTIRKRGIEEKAAAWRKKLRVPKSGRCAATLVFTRDLRDKWVAYGCID